MIRLLPLSFLSICGCLLAQPRPAPDLDAKLAAFYEVSSRAVPIEKRIAEFAEVNSGLKPKDLVIENAETTKYEDHLPASARRTIASGLLETAILNSDLVIMGAPVTSRSLLIKDGSFLFTEYVVRVDDVYFDRIHTITSGASIIVSRTGGQLRVNDVVIKAVDPAFDQFSLKQTYIFALIHIPETGTYRATGMFTFVMAADNVVVSASKLERDFQKDLPTFLSEVREVVTYMH